MKTVLIVEDSADMVTILRRRFAEAQFDVNVMVDGLDLLAYIRNRKGPAPDAMVLDLMLPGRSGYDVLSMVKAVWPQTKVFIFSAHREYRRMIPPGVVERFFLKTDGVENLVHAVQQSLAEADSPAASPPPV